MRAPVPPKIVHFHKSSDILTSSDAKLISHRPRTVVNRPITIPSSTSGGVHSPDLSELLRGGHDFSLTQPVAENLNRLEVRMRNILKHAAAPQPEWPEQGLVRFLHCQLSGLSEPDQLTWPDDRQAEAILLAGFDQATRQAWLMNKLSDPGLGDTMKRMLGMQAGLPIDEKMPESWLLHFLLPELTEKACLRLRQYLVSIAPDGLQVDVVRVARVVKDMLEANTKPYNVEKRLMSRINADKKSFFSGPGALFTPDRKAHLSRPGSRPEVAQALLSLLQSFTALSSQIDPHDDNLIGGMRTRLAMPGLSSYERAKLQQRLAKWEGEQALIHNQKLTLSGQQLQAAQKRLNESEVNVARLRADGAIAALAAERGVLKIARAQVRVASIRHEAAMAARPDVPQAVSDKLMSKALAAGRQKLDVARQAAGAARALAECKGFLATRPYSAPSQEGAPDAPEGIMSNLMSMGDPVRILDRLRDALPDQISSVLLPGASAMQKLSHAGLHADNRLPPAGLTTGAPPDPGKLTTVMPLDEFSDIPLLNSTMVPHNLLNEWARKEADLYFGPLWPHQRRRYIELVRRSGKEDKLDKEIAHQLDLLAKAMGVTSLDGYYFHTDKLDARKGETHTLSGPLKDFVRYGIDLSLYMRTGTAEEFIARSRINRDPVGQSLAKEIDVGGLIDEVRRQNPGKAVKEYAETLVGDKYEINYHAAGQFELALLEALRYGSISPEEFLVLKMHVLLNIPLQTGSLRWSGYQLKLKGLSSQPDSGFLFSDSRVTDDLESITFGVERPSLAIWTVEMNDGQGARRAFLYAPGRPGGALRSYMPGTSPIPQLEEEIKADLRNGRRGWILKGLTQAQRLKLLSLIKVDPVNESAMNPLAKVLYNLLKGTPALEDIQISEGPKLKAGDQSFVGRMILYHTGMLEMSLPEAMAIHEIQRLRQDGATSFITNGSADWRMLSNAAKRIAREFMTLMMMPVPGAVSLPGRNMLFRFTLLGDAGQAVLVGIDGNWRNLLEVAADVVDVAVGMKAAASVAKLHRSKYNAFALTKNTSGQMTVWQPATLSKMTSADPIPAGVKGADSVWREGNDCRVQLQTSKGMRVARVVSTDGDWRLTHPELGNITPLLEHRGGGIWRIAVDETVGLTSEKILMLMLPTALQGVDDRALTHILTASQTDRAELERVWQGGEPTLSLSTALKEFRARSLPDITAHKLLDPRFMERDDPMEWLVAAWLADKTDCDLRIYDRNIVLLRRYLPSGLQASGTDRPILALMRTDSWHYDVISNLTPEYVERENSLFASVLLGRDGFANPELNNQARLLRMECGFWFSAAENQEKVQSALRHAGRNRARVPVSEGALLPVFSNTQPSREPAWRQVVRSQYPALPEAYLDVALQHQPQLGRVQTLTQLDSDTQKWLSDSEMQVRRTTALMGILTPGAQSLTADVPPLFMPSMLALPGFPSDVAIILRTSSRQTLLGGWGPETASRFITVFGETSPEGFEHYRAWDEKNQQLLPPQPGQHSLASALLHAMTDEMRQAIRINLYDSAGLQAAVAAGAVNIAGIPAYNTGGSISPHTELMGLQSGKDMRYETPDVHGIYRDRDQNKYIIHAGKTYRVLEDTASSRPNDRVWRVVSDNTSGSRKTSAASKSGLAHHTHGVALHRVYGEWSIASHQSGMTPGTSDRTHKTLEELRVKDQSFTGGLYILYSEKGKSAFIKYLGNDYIKTDNQQQGVHFYQIRKPLNSVGYFAEIVDPDAPLKPTGVVMQYTQSSWVLYTDGEPVNRRGDLPHHGRSQQTNQVTWKGHISGNHDNDQNFFFDLQSCKWKTGVLRNIVDPVKGNGAFRKVWTYSSENYAQEKKGSNVFIESPVFRPAELSQQRRALKAFGIPHAPLLSTDLAIQGVPKALPGNLVQIWVGPNPVRQSDIDNVIKNHHYFNNIRQDMRHEIYLSSYREDVFSANRDMLNSLVKGVIIVDFERSEMFRSMALEEGGKYMEMYQKAIDIGFYAGAANVLRFYTIWKDGGMYLDMDDVITTTPALSQFSVAKNNVLVGPLVSNRLLNMKAEINNNAFASHQSNPVIKDTLEISWEKFNKNRDFLSAPRPRLSEVTEKKLIEFSSKRDRCFPGPANFNQALTKDSRINELMLLRDLKQTGVILTPFQEEKLSELNSFPFIRMGMAGDHLINK